MKQKPILFSTPMVQAILEGRKTMTRRTVKFPKNWNHKDDVWDWVALKDFHPNVFKYKVGDVLWVRETFLFYSDENANDAVLYKAEPHADEFSKGLFEGKPKWKPSIFMPKEACRIFLEITDIKVERLQDISEEDAIKEGIESEIKADRKWFYNYLTKEFSFLGSENVRHEHLGKIYSSSQISFVTLWKSINGIESWEANPFVWVISFKQIEKPENFK